MKKKNLIFNCIICIIFALFVLANLFISNGTYSALENRYLQGLPAVSLSAIADRSFMDEAENYSNDQLLFRNFFIKAKAIVEQLLGKKENNGVYYAKDNYLIEKPADADSELVQKNIDAVKTLAELNRFDVSVCIIPQSFEILQDKLPKGTYSDVIPAFYNKLVTALGGTDAELVNPTGILSEHKNDYIFYRSDHHQTSEGSYLVYQSLGQACGFSPLGRDAFVQEEVSNTFLGTTYSKGLTGTKSDIISVYKTEINQQAAVEFYGEEKRSDSLFFPEHLDKKDQYSYFLDGNHGVTVMTGGMPNGRKLALFKDSYAHSLAPFLINHFESIHLIDMRYFMDDPIRYLAENDIHQVLLLYGTSTFMSDDTIQKIGEYSKTSPYAHYGLVKECAPVDAGYFADAVFLGDSLSLGFEVYSGFYDATFLCRTSMSVGGVFNREEDGTSLVEKVSAAKPKKIYVMLGMNETLTMEYKEMFMYKYTNLIDALKQDNPDAVIYMQSILPVSREEAKKGRIDNAAVHHFNACIRELTEDKQIYFIDVYKAVTDAEGYLLSELTGDGIHLGREGCKLWADYLLTHVVDPQNVDSVISLSDMGQEFVQGDYDLQSLLSELQQSVSFQGDVGETSPGMLIKTHGIEKELVTYACGVVGGGATAEEIALFEAKDAAKAKEIKKLLESYIKTRMKSFESYIPEEVPKLKSAIVYTKGKLVALVIADDTGTARQKLEKVK